MFQSVSAQRRREREREREREGHEVLDDAEAKEGKESETVGAWGQREERRRGGGGLVWEGRKEPY